MDCATVAMRRQMPNYLVEGNHKVVGNEIVYIAAIGYRPYILLYGRGKHFKHEALTWLHELSILLIDLLNTAYREVTKVMCMYPVVVFQV